ncbi:hypothetical protein LTR15_012466 [Elasticomyces elasticus]|nr:hypothetical protein LTR15_012466 [Elasticomyces elasticus]
MQNAVPPELAAASHASVEGYCMLPHGHVRLRQHHVGDHQLLRPLRPGHGSQHNQPCAASLADQAGCGQQPEQQQQEQPVMAAAPMLHCLAYVLAFKTNDNDGNKDPGLASSAGCRNQPGVLVDPKNFDGVAGRAHSTESCLLVHALLASPSRSASTPSALRSSSTPFASSRCLPFLRSISESSLSSKKRSFLTTVRESKAVQNELGTGWIYDDNKLAWSMT